MNELTARSVPSHFEVLLIIPFDAEETLGADVCADLRSFVSQGLRVAIVGLSHGTGSKHYRNSSLIKLAFEMRVPVLGPRDVTKSQLAIVYQPALLLKRVVRVSFLAQNLWLIFDGADLEAADIDSIISRTLDFSTRTPKLLAANERVQEELSGRGWPVELWNFHAVDSDYQQIHGAGKTPCDRLMLGVPAADLGRAAVADLKIISDQAARSGHTVSIRAAVPSVLQRGRGEQDYLIGFPYIEDDAVSFLSSLSMYVVPCSMLYSGVWRSDVYLCMKLGIPVLLPRVLEPYFGDAALYFENYAQGFMLNEALKMSRDSERLARAKNLFWQRVNTRSHDLLDLAGLRAGGRTDAAQVEASQAAPWPGGSPGESGGRVCFVTSNGAGMGHLTRLLAVARRLEDGVEATFLSMSQACGVVAQYGFRYEYVPSKGDLQVGGPEWNTYFNKRFMDALIQLNPDVVVFDGTWPYQGVARALATYDAKFVWMRRGMWRAETPDTALVRNTGFDSVIEPGDLASSYDRGPTGRARDAYKVEPIIVMDPSEVLDKKAAREQLGIDHDDKCMLITLGAGNINSVDKDVEDIIGAVRRLPDDWRIFMTSSAIADNVELMADVQALSIYPLARVARAFDFVVSATGYNSFHEWIAYAVPALWIANPNTTTDDQIGRARYAHDAGLGLDASLGGAVSIEDAVQQLASPVVRKRMETKMRHATFDNGALSAAQHISSLTKSGSLR